MSVESYYVILAPVITEESTIQMETRNQYAFQVNPRANKKQIQEAVEEIFPNVTVTSVNTMNYRGKQVRRGRTQGRRRHWKKAIVTLAEGDRIDLL